MEHGFELFGREHLTALALLMLVGLATHALLRRGSARAERSTRALVAGALALAHMSESLVAWWQGWYRLDMIPLHLCDVTALLAVYGLLTLDRRAVEPLYFFALSGTLPGLVTPDLESSIPSFTFVVFFLEHGLTVLAAFMLVVSLRLAPRPGAWLRASLLLNALALIVTPVNLALGTNFMFLMRKPDGRTPFDWFGPWPGYVLVLELLVLVVFRGLEWLARTATFRRPPTPSLPTEGEGEAVVDGTRVARPSLALGRATPGLSLRKRPGS